MKISYDSNGKRIFFRVAYCGLSLLEVIIALTILSVSALGIIGIFRSSGSKAENFSTEHFTAMFLAQKILEDVNFRCVENPYFFDQLIASASGEIKKVVSPASEYFNLLENTKNFSNLNLTEDKSFTDQSAPIYKQLKKFSYRVETKFVLNKETGNPYPNLIDIIVHIYWHERSGKDNSYTISQRLHGTRHETFTSIKTELTEPFDDESAGKALWNKVFPDKTPVKPLLDSYMSKNDGGDRKIVKAIGDLIYIDLFNKELASEYDAKITELENKIDNILKITPINYIELALSKEKIAKLYEEEASKLFLAYAKLLSSIEILKNSTLNETSMGKVLFSGKESLSGLCWAALQANNQIIMYFTATQKVYIQLLNTAYSKGIDKRKQTDILRRLIAVEKLIILLRNPLETTNVQLKALKGQLQDLKKQYIGKQPIFIEYLREELKICNSIDSLCEYYGGSAGLNNLIVRIGQSRQKFFKIEDKL